jgi:hypothetical protein
MKQKAQLGSLFDSFADDLLAERSPRPLIIVGASKVDDLLGQILAAFLLPKISRTKDPDELIEGDAPLGTFSARTKICRRLGIIDETLYRAIDRLRILRNLSAHSVSFDHSQSPAREHLAELGKQVADRASYRLTRGRFFEGATLQPVEELQCSLLTLCVLLEAIHEKVERTSGNKNALVIASK